MLGAIKAKHETIGQRMTQTSMYFRNEEGQSIDDITYHAVNKIEVDEAISWTMKHGLTPFWF